MLHSTSLMKQMKLNSSYSPNDMMIKRKNNSYSQRRPLWAVMALLSIFLWTSCKSDRLESDAQSAPQVTYDVPVQLNLSALVSPEARNKKSDVRALDYVLNQDETTGALNPLLEPEQFKNKNGIDVHLIFVCTSDDNQPVSIVKTKLYPDANAENYRFLRTNREASVNLASGTDLTRGSWVMAVYYGDIDAGGTATVDPNKLEAVKPAGDEASDASIDAVWNAGRSNITRLVQSAKGQKSLAANEKSSLAIPFMSEWVPLAGHVTEPRGAGNEPHVEVHGIQLYPQGTLMRVRLHNSGFSDIKLAGFRILTNSLSFRGKYDFSSDKLREKAKNNKDLSTLYTEQNALGEAYIDSVGRTRAFPSYADFWVDKNNVETVTNGSASDYYLIWAMPRRSPNNTDASRKGILHLLAYDANRMGEGYNKTFTPDNKGIIPKALIRKPALTRSFGEGFFRLSSASQSGTYYFLDGVQTPIYNFLDFMSHLSTDTEPSRARAAYYTKEEMERYTSPTSGRRVARKSDWAGIFPVKYPDNGGNIPGFGMLTHYYMNNTNVGGKVFNSNRYNGDGSELIEQGNRAVLLLTLDEADGNPPHFDTPAADRDKAGKANNRQIIHVPAAMKVPTFRSGQIQPTSASDENLLFSTYNANAEGLDYVTYVLTGWGQGQSYLTATAYQYRENDDWRVKVTSRYLGPAYHRPYGGTWKEKYPWDISFYMWRNFYPGANPRTHTELEDTHRDLYGDGYQLNGVRPRGGVRDSGNTTMYWGADGSWFYFYPNQIQIDGARTKVQSGYGAPGNANRTELYTDADKPAALIRTFSDTPVMPRQ